MKRCNFASRFRKNEDGSASIESLLWIPIFTFFLVLCVDVSFVYYGKTQALRIIQDANRSFSVGNLDEPAQVKTQVIAALAAYSTSVVMETPVVNSGVITTTVKIPTNDLVSIGAIPALQNRMITIVAQHYVEQ